jgi:hypothetical protein
MPGIERLLPQVVPSRHTVESGAGAVLIVTVEKAAVADESWNVTGGGSRVAGCPICAIVHTIHDAFLAGVLADKAEFAVEVGQGHVVCCKYTQGLVNIPRLEVNRSPMIDASTVRGIPPEEVQFSFVFDRRGTGRRRDSTAEEATGCVAPGIAIRAGIMEDSVFAANAFHECVELVFEESGCQGVALLVG